MLYPGMTCCDDNTCLEGHKTQPVRGVAVAIFSFRFHVLYFPVGYRFTISYLTKYENQIVFHIVKWEFNFRGKKKHLKKQSSLQIKVDYDIYFVCMVSKVTLY